LKSKLTAMAGVPALVPLTGCSKSEKPHYGISFACWPGDDILSPRLYPSPEHPCDIGWMSNVVNAVR
jgi:hypothetical protein